jgi:hypothetical protein
MHTARTFLHLPARADRQLSAVLHREGSTMWKLIVCNTVSIDGYD